MRDVYICDAVRTPIGRFGGSLAKVRADDLAAVPIKALMAKHPGLDWSQVDEVFFGCANQAGEDNRNVARMALLLAGFPVPVTGTTINRLCGSGMDAVLAAAAPFVKTGGRLVYATCSFLMEENEDRLSAFMESHSGYRVRKAATEIATTGLIAPQGAALLERFATPEGYLRLTPHRVRADGFFIAVLEKTG